MVEVLTVFVLKLRLLPSKRPCRCDCVMRRTREPRHGSTFHLEPTIMNGNHQSPLFAHVTNHTGLHQARFNWLDSTYSSELNNLWRQDQLLIQSLLGRISGQGSVRLKFLRLPTRLTLQWMSSARVLRKYITQTTVV